MNSQPAISASILLQSSRTELSLKGIRISPGLASGTVWVAGDILDCSAEAHRIEPHQGQTADSCTVTLTVTRNQIGEVDPAFTEGGRVVAHQVRAASFTSTP